jgi:hypothetical protein
VVRGSYSCLAKAAHSLLQALGWVGKGRNRIVGGNQLDLYNISILNLHGDRNFLIVSVPTPGIS